jgi:hypothetical protein
MKGLVATLLLLGAPLAAVAADRFELAGQLDVRWVHSNSEGSFLNGGSGILRFDQDHQDLQPGRAFMSAKFRLTDLLSLHAVADAYGDGDRNSVDLSELWLEARPFPTSALRWRLRAGAFYLPTSLENRGPGWSSVYTITPSALNSWYGEELRSIGAEAEARWLGASSGYAGDVAAVAGAYGWNDPAGVLVAEQGFSLRDRPSTLFGGLGRPPVGLYHEIDKRPGFYGGLSWRHGDGMELRTLYYDNRGNPTAETHAGYAWLTRFLSAGARFEPDAHWTFIAQYLDGYTVVEEEDAGGALFRTGFRGAFGLGSYEWDRNRLTLRHDRFTTRPGLIGAPGSAPANRGHAWTLGWTHDFDDAWQVSAEWIRATSTFASRSEYGRNPFMRESQTQVAVRYRFRASF